jgi:hypothetical protein
VKKTPILNFFSIRPEKRHGFETLFKFYVKFENAIFVDVF